MERMQNSGKKSIKKKSCKLYAKYKCNLIGLNTLLIVSLRRSELRGGATVVTFLCFCGVLATIFYINSFQNLTKLPEFLSLISQLKTGL